LGEVGPGYEVFRFLVAFENRKLLKLLLHTVRFPFGACNVR
jgi:hypothetical protein